MNVFEAKNKAEKCFNESQVEIIVSTCYEYVIVSDVTGEAMIVPDLNTAYQCDVKWIFKARRNNGITVVELCEIH